MRNKNKEQLKCLNQAKIYSQVIHNKTHARSLKNVWSLDEYQFLIDNWGKLSKKEISEKLGRSINAISVKANRLKLSNFFLTSDYVSLNELHRLIYGRNIDSYTLGQWTRYKMPYKKIATRKKVRIKAITLNDFMDWFHKNLKLINLSKTKKGFLGIEEPKWMRIKRVADKKGEKYKMRDWTMEDDKLLKSMTEDNKTTYKEACIALNRTGGAIKRRMCDLKLPKRLKKQSTRSSNWSEEQIKTVEDLWKKGFIPAVIAEYIEGKSDLAINGILERYKYFGDPPLKYKL